MKKIILPFFVIVCVIPLASSCFANNINECRNAFDKKDYVKAENSCSALIKKNPKNNVARLYLAKIYAIKNKFNLSLSECKQIYETEKDTDLGKSAKELENKLKLIQLIAESKEKKANRSIRDITTGALSCKENKDLTQLDCLFPCKGNLVVNLNDKTLLMSYPDGETIQEHENGTYTITRKSNKIISNGMIVPPEKNFRKSCSIQKDGSTFIIRNDETQEYHYKNGERKEILPSGQVLLYKKDGSIEILKPPTK